MDIKKVIIRCALYKLAPQYQPSRVAVRNAIDELANIMPVIGYELDEADRSELTEIIYAKLDLKHI